jgi:hypothetical protein
VTPVVLWIVGEPGVGKTSLVNALLGSPTWLTPKGWPRWTFNHDGSVIASGHRTTGKDVGTNAYVNLRWWRENAWTTPLTLLEGDEYRHPMAPRQLPDADVRCVLLEGANFAEERRRRQGNRLGPTLAKVEFAKAEDFATNFPGPTARILADLPPPRLAEIILDFAGFNGT